MSRERLKSRAVQGLVRVGPRLLELRGQLPGRRTTELFCDPLDAHSWLLAQQLWRRQSRLPRDFAFHWVTAPGPALDPEPDKRVSNASRDVRLLSECFDLDSSAAPRRESLGELAPERALAVALGTLAAHSSLERLAAASAGLADVFSADEPPTSLDYSAAAPRLREEMRAGGARQRKLGHYQGAMLYDRGAWYWGIDRLPLWLARVSGQPVELLEAEVFRPRTVPRATARAGELRVYFSFRSPYSYLAVGRAAELADRYGLTLRLSPVLPMVMRGLAVPPQKKFYILFDAAREAARLGIPFGRICDPVGAGVERCLAAFSAAEGHSQQLAFVLGAFEAIWSESVNVASDAGLRPICEAAGVAWTRVQAELDHGEWRALASGNQDELTRLRLWGVPSFRLGERALWGQDRLRVLECMLDSRA